MAEQTYIYVIVGEREPQPFRGLESLTRMGPSC